MDTFMAKRGGRPTVYKPEYTKQVEKLCLLGAIDEQLASFFNVTRMTILRWKGRYPDFVEAIDRGKEVANSNIAASLYKRGMGASHPETKVFVIDGEIQKVEVTKHHPPDTTAAIFFLKNRDPENWKDKQDLGITGKDGESIVWNVNFK